MKSVFEILFDVSFDMIAILSLSGEFQNINPSFKQGLGWTLSALKRKSFWDLIVSDHDTDLSSVADNISKGHPVILAENQFIYFDGTTHLLRWTAYPDIKTGSIITMITNSSLASKNQEFFNHYIETSPTATLIVNQGKINYANKLSELLFGYSVSEMVGCAIEMLVPDHLQSIHTKHRKSFEKQPHLRMMGMNLELSGKKKNGDQFPVDIGLNPINTPEGVATLCSVIDLTRQKASESVNTEKIRELEREISVLGRLARTDELTGILNRRALFKQLDLLIRMAQNKNQPLSLILFDIDNFKQYNDTYGHLEGDQVLKSVADIIASSTRKTEVVARYGGEEFAVILPATYSDEAKTLAERMRRTIEAFDWPFRDITISVGISTLYPNSITGENLLETNQLIIMADQALYFSKRTGKNLANHFNDLVIDPKVDLLEWELKHDTPAEH